MARRTTVKVNLESARLCAPVSIKTGLTPVRTLTRACFKRLGTDKIAQTEILLIINELGTNIIRHGLEGKICISPVAIRKHVGFFIQAYDIGPGIHDVDSAFSKGRSEDKGLGMGLNVVKSLADDVRVASRRDGGTQIEVWKWIF